MSLFARICVLRGFPAAAYREVAFLSRFAGTENPCACPVKCLPCEMRSLFNRGEAYLTGAALIQTKIAHLWIGNATCPIKNYGWPI